MKILVSACLLGENCKYSGGNNYNQAVCDFARGHQVVPVCPEVLGGLPTPRCPAEIVQGVVTNKEGINVDQEFRAGAAKALAAVAHAQLVAGAGRAVHAAALRMNRADTLRASGKSARVCTMASMPSAKMPV